VPVVVRAVRAALRALLPADTDLPWRHWRWLWAAGALRLFFVLPFGVVIFIPYLFCRVFTDAADWLGERCGNFYATCHNRDLWAAGWRAPLQRVPDLDPERKARA
jgi:hypothetical protein